MEELEREKTSARLHTRTPEELRVLESLESLKLARKELESQMAATTHERRRTQIAQALEEIDRRMETALHPLAAQAVAPEVQEEGVNTFDRFDRSRPPVSRRHQARFHLDSPDRLGYLDRASQPNPFDVRRRAGLSAFSDPAAQVAYTPPPVSYDRLHVKSANASGSGTGWDLASDTRCCRRGTAWHVPLVAPREPVERQPASHRGACDLCGAAAGFAETAVGYHYAADRHARSNTMHLRRVCLAAVLRRASRLLSSC